MKKCSESLTHTLLSFTLLCGALCALLTIGSIHLSSAQAIPADSGLGLDAGDILSSVTIVIDAGHGGEDGGAQSEDGVYEKTLNLEIAEILNTMLRANGIATVMTRTEDVLLYDRNTDFQGRKKMLDLTARRRIAEETENPVFVSIHMNSFPESRYSGLQVFYSPNDPLSECLAAEIRQYTRQYIQPNNHREIKAANSSIYLLDRLQCPAVLVECGFLSNPEESILLANPDYQQKVAFVLFCSIMSYISEKNA